MTGPVDPRLDRRVLATGLDHAEGLCWDPVRGCLWAVGEAGQVYRVELTGEVAIVTSIPGAQGLGVALDAAGVLYVCDPARHQVWRVDEGGEYEPFGDPIDYPNYPAFGPRGELYVSDSGSFDRATGRLVVIEPDGTTRDISPRPFAFANGLALNGTTLWIVESATPGVSAFDLETGTLERVIELERCVPDGLAVDGAGGLLISCYQPNQLWHWDPRGGLTLLVDDWTGEYILSPTNIAFYGPDLDRLALASLCGTTLTTIAVPFPGRLVQYPYQPTEVTT